MLNFARGNSSHLQLKGIQTLLSALVVVGLSACSGDDGSAGSATETDGDSTGEATEASASGSASATTGGSESGSASGSTGGSTGATSSASTTGETGESDSETGSTTEDPPVVCDGFDDDPESWDLPEGYAELNFVGPGQAKCDESDSTWHSLLDVDGDGALDLVVTNLCDGSQDPGTDEWLVYLGVEGGFTMAPTKWSLPGGYAALNFVSTTQEKCDESDSTWHSVFDVDGDARPDLIVRNLCDGSSNPGTDYWLVYRGVDGGFAADPEEWALPGGYADLNFIRTSQAKCDESNSSWHSVLDLDGDARPDLLVQNLCDGSSNPGTDHWQVYFGGEGGFDGSAVEWALPGGYADLNFISTSQAKCDESDSTWHSLLDLSGDGALELVVGNVCDGSVNPGTDHWLVYGPEGEGFADDPVEWSLPGGYANLNFIATSQAKCDESDSSWHSLMTLSGDSRPDLVVTNLCDGSEEPGTQSWRVYPGEDGGFAESPVEWTLPAGYASLNFISPSQAKCDESDSSWHSTIALRGGPSQELVVTNVCDGSTEPGTTSWRVYSASCAP